MTRRTRILATIGPASREPEVLDALLSVGLDAVRLNFSRLHQFVRLSNAFVVVDGGIGTTLEMLMVWQLLQVKHVHDVPLVLVGPMWRALIEWARTHMLSPAAPLASAPDIDIPTCVDTVEEAAAVIEAHLARFEAARATTATTATT